MRWKKDFSAVDCRLTGLLVVMLVLGVCGCAGQPLKIVPAEHVRPDVLAAAWDKLVNVETMDARGVLRLEDSNGQKNSQRVRFTAKAPGRLKVQCLTPWYTVAWQLLIVNREFWLSDSKGRITYHGDLGMGIPTGPCAQHNGWWTYIELMASWRLLFSRPTSMPMNAEKGTAQGRSDLPVTHTQYLVTEDGLMPAGKIIRFTDGTEWRVTYDDFITDKDGGVFPQRLEIICSAVKLDLRFKGLRLNNELKEKFFTYQQKNFSLKEVDCYNFFIP